MKLKTKLAVGAGLTGLGAAVLVTVMAASAFDPNQSPVGYVGQPVPSTLNVSTGNAKMFSIDYKSSDWSGNMHRFAITSSGAVGETDEWIEGAGPKITKQLTRYIFTTTDGNTGVPFQWDQLSSAQQAAMDTDPVSSTQSNVLNYLRGSKENEGTGTGQFRKRNSVLGDIIHSTPVYWKDTAGNETVFVGANDGMMHAINAADGSERFAFVPSTVMGRMKSLTSPAYSHQYYVDGRFDLKNWDGKTILMGALGAGGKGIYALDVTNAAVGSEAVAATKFMWERNNKSDGYANLGYTYGAPNLVRLKDPTGAATSGVKRIVMGNGYGNEGSGTATLYIINALDGSVIKEINTNEGSTASPNGLSSPSLWDSNNDGFKDTAYAGDIDGNMWKIMLESPYTVTKLQAKTTNAAHAVTMAPGLMAHPSGGVMVTYVTGRMLTTADATDTTKHYAYGIWDGAPSVNTALRENVLTEVNYVANGVTVRVRTATDNKPIWTAGATNHRGWRTELPLGGERVVGDGAFVTGTVFQFFSTNPTINANKSPPGENWWMQLNVMTGGQSDSVLFDLNDDDDFTEADTINDLNPVGRYMGGGVRSQLIALSASGVDVFQSNFDRNGAAPVETVVVTTKPIVGERGVSGGHFDTDFMCYNNCGGATTGGYTGVASSSGNYGVGRNSGGVTDGINYIHVHEYDDIYDVVGINMLHPSQDKQRLALAQYSGNEVFVPDTPTFKANETFPAGALKISEVYEPPTSSKNSPGKIVTHSETARVLVAGYPTSSTAGGTTTTITKWTYVTTQTARVPTGSSYNNGTKRWNYTMLRTVRTWTTEVTRTEIQGNPSFKLLLANQAYSPAVNFAASGATSDTSAKPNASYNGKAYQYQNTSTLAIADMPIYTMSGISKLEFKMPLDAFNIRDWGTGVTRTGLHPIRPHCAGIVNLQPTPGPLGEWRNGALTLQIVKSDIVAGDVQLNVAGRPELGWRLTAAALKTKLVAEYLIYWHHFNETCMASSGWTKAPPQDTSPSDAQTGVKAAGASDPSGNFVPGVGDIEDVVVPTPPADKIVVNADGSTTITSITYTPLAGGGYTETTTVRTIPKSTGSGVGGADGIVTGGGVNIDGSIKKDGEDKNAPNLGRINWRELQR